MVDIRVCVRETSMQIILQLSHFSRSLNDPPLPLIWKDFGFSGFTKWFRKETLVRIDDKNNLAFWTKTPMMICANLPVTLLS